MGSGKKWEAPDYHVSYLAQINKITKFSNKKWGEVQTFRTTPGYSHEESLYRLALLRIHVQKQPVRQDTKRNDLVFSTLTIVEINGYMKCLIQHHNSLSALGT